MTSFKAAVVQAGSVLFDTQRSLDKLEDLAADAARHGAKLVVFPEAFIGGYPKGFDFGARLGQRSGEGRDDFRRYFDGAIAEHGPEAAGIAEVARANAIYLVVGVIERDGGTLYCTTLAFDAHGGYLGKHRKLMPTALERLVWGFGDGSTLPVFDTPLGKIGSVICWENYMPLLRMAMYAKGIELYCAPTVDDRDAWLPTMRMIALEGRCFVLSACQYLMPGDYPAPYADRLGGKNEPVIRGGSCIIGPLGDVLVPPSFDGERIALAEIDPGQIARGKYDLDVVGHYARPDVFQLTVDERKKDPVIRKG
ncbi:MAG TPA: carbon-nitrogen hydrolase family protein [Rhizomicrobium sp.]|nr:carbon-nitrogen hydrolase family protein [Rhizomicrobium sp.]